MREHFGIKQAPSLYDLHHLETHCFDILRTVLEKSITESLNYMTDGMEANVIWSDGKRYRIEVKPIREKAQ